MFTYTVCYLYTLSTINMYKNLVKKNTLYQYRQRNERSENVTVFIVTYLVCGTVYLDL